MIVKYKTTSLKINKQGGGVYDRIAFSGDRENGDK